MTKDIAKIKLKNKALATIITMILLTSMALTLFAIPTANGWNSATQAAVDAGMKWDFPNAANYDASNQRLYLWNTYEDKLKTFMFVVPSPQIVGVGQTLSIQMYQPQVPPNSLAVNDIRYYGYIIEVTKPDGTTERLGPPEGFTSDPTGTTYTLYTPDQVGNYSVLGIFPEQTYRWYETSGMRSFYGVTFLESRDTATFTVQEEPVSQLTWEYPLPTDYWQRPIHSMNTEWYRVSSNWLNSKRDRDFGGTNNRFQPDGLAPNSPHILWNRPVQDGGVVGGSRLAQNGNEFYSGTQYNIRTDTVIIMHGRLYYELPAQNSGDGGGWISVDLRTGEEIWYNPIMGMSIPGPDPPEPNFGYYYAAEYMNQHGIIPPGLLFSSNFAVAFNPQTQANVFNVTNVPSQSSDSYGETEFIGSHGEHLRYVMQNAGNSTNPDWRLLQWNSSRLWNFGTSPTTSSTVDAGTPNRFDWNVSIPWRNTIAPTGQRVQVIGGLVEDVLVIRNDSTAYATVDITRPQVDFPQEISYTAVSIKPDGTAGQTLWSKTLQSVSADRQNLQFRRAAEGVLLFYWTPTISWVAYDMHTGEKLWEQTPETDLNPYAYFGASTLYNQFSHSVAYGTLYTGGYLGGLRAYDLRTGEIKFTTMFPTNMSIFEYYAAFIGTIADGKVFTGTHEHSAQTPLFKGHRLRAINATSGEQVWSIYGWANPDSMAVADGVLAYLDLYDMTMNAIGKGPSATTVTAPKAAIPYGQSLVISGTVLDIAAGTKQAEQAARFPNGVAAVSDASMSSWMEYVYKQKPFPTDVTGVEVTLTVIDANNNQREIGKATTNSDGLFAFNWEPDIEGQYTVYASFAGSESFWPSHAVTSFAVDPAPQTQTPETPAQGPSMADIYLVPGIIAIIAAIVVVGAVIVLMLRKRP